MTSQRLLAFQERLTALFRRWQIAITKDNEPTQDNEPIQEEKLVEKLVKPIEPYQTSLSANNAYWMARISALAYFANDDKSPNDALILQTLKADDPNFLSVHGVSENSAQAILVEHKDYLCFAFRGTDELGDWLDNLNLFPEKALFGEFHRGFW
ncbi:MAG: hypothetical protein F6K09_22695, partial [Merismopedia sp. SIO2A8]|nr:hypothetical protein [Merismopedia sp. SIO2A8]